MVGLRSDTQMVEKTETERTRMNKAKKKALESMSDFLNFGEGTDINGMMAYGMYWEEEDVKEAIDIALQEQAKEYKELEDKLEEAKELILNVKCSLMNLRQEK